MRLCFLRHGVAADRQEWSGEDALRPLTDKGRKRLSRVAELLAGQRLGLETVLTSPLLRCVQTAELVAERLGLADRVVPDNRLAPGFKATALATLLRPYGDAAALLLVGHEPDFSDAIGHLIGGGRVVCRKGGVACVNLSDLHAMEGELEWLLSPDLL